jgi:hypothetical protein
MLGAMGIIRLCISFWSRLHPAGKLLLIGLGGLSPGVSRAAVPATVAVPCALAWDASPDPRVTGYAVYYGLAGSTATHRLDAGAAQTATVYNLTVAADYFFYVVSYGTNQAESSPSPAIYYRPPALSSLRLIPQTNGTVTLQFRTAPGAVGSIQYTLSWVNPNWKTAGTATADAEGMITITNPVVKRFSTCFYRAVR